MIPDFLLHVFALNISQEGLGHHSRHLYKNIISRVIGKNIFRRCERNVILQSVLPNSLRFDKIKRLLTKSYKPNRK